MSRIPTIDPAQATGKQKTLLEAVQKKLGRTPNLTRVLANAPSALEGYLQFSGALATGSLPAAVREQIALTVAEANLCEYCLAAHTAIGGMVGLDTAATQAARSASASDPKVDAILKFARSVVVNRGKVTDQDLSKARAAGVGDGEIIETTAHVALNLLTNYVNHVADTVVDFPKVEASAAQACGTDACSTHR
ncbi:MAG: carboxymuconolactone decarboxylase family protein [Planctomycetes bacterium]|nr:carboxymuconolactone decarboxylase family protein [Planctomycetota bacterium]MCB9886684.1 carboxymuconolactone decarboxylase family protein [Planctomycetota bacterium]